MKNIEELKKLIVHYNVGPNLFAGYVCIGYGSPRSESVWLRNKFGIGSTDLYSLSIASRKMTNNMMETSGGTLYYITEELAKTHDLMTTTNPKTLETRLIEAKTLLLKLQERGYKAVSNSFGGEYAFDKDFDVSVHCRNISTVEHSITTKKWFNDNPTENVCVVFAKKDGIHVTNYPVDYVIPPSEEIVVKVNDSYDAKVTKDKIIVGCQEIDPKVIEEIANALKKLQ